MNSSSPLPLRAAIIAVGSELLTPFRTDTNSLFITSGLNDLGIEVVVKVVAGDRRGELAAVIRESLRRADLLVLTGGLGPTADDVTRRGGVGCARPAARRGRRHRRADPAALRAAGHGDARRQPRAGAGAGRCRRAPECQRHRAGAVGRARGADRPAAPRAAARDAPDVRGRPGRAAPAARDRRPTVSPRRQDRRADRVRRGAGDAAGLLAVRGVAAAGGDQYPGGAGPDRTALLGACRERGTRRRDSGSRDGRDRWPSSATTSSAPTDGRSSRSSAICFAAAAGGSRPRNRAPAGSSPRASPTFRGVPTTSSAASWPTATWPRPSCSACRRR